jgi:hypothetical protein
MRIIPDCLHVRVPFSFALCICLVLFTLLSIFCFHKNRSNVQVVEFYIKMYLLTHFLSLFQEQSMHEFKEFHSKFNLKVGEGGGGPAPLSPTTPTVR